jgi:hypothetical protein
MVPVRSVGRLWRSSSRAVQALLRRENIGTRWSQQLALAILAGITPDAACRITPREAMSHLTHFVLCTRT